VALPRGFKAQAERTVQTLRDQIGADPSAPLDLRLIAGEIGARIVSADELVSVERLQEIERIQAYAFSACTFEINDRPIIVFNPIRQAPRQTSDIAHELAHIILGHELTEIQYLDGVAFRTCQPDQEEQATAFAGTLLLPREILLAEARRGATIEKIARKFGVTKRMAQFRWNTTGVERQIAAARRQRRA
jgi:Zn-dependent peptidase ImmA (M78 family)